ncbi:MAG: MotA/TolQ/ExbB proton channel family protein [Prevotella sp.]|nr:MotA/TolQ/ExbB proton channel family protein [Prevotella sp.]
MKTFIFRVCFFTIVLLLPVVASAQSSDEGVSASMSDNGSQVEVVDASSPKVVDAQPEIVANEAQVAEADGGFHMVLKKKFIEGNAFFMSLVALALVLGLAFCIERIIYLTMSQIRTREFMQSLEKHINADDIEGAKALCRNTRGPVASICYQGLMRIDEPVDDIERSIASYGNLQVANLEKGCSWIRLFITIAPSLGFLGTVIGMVMAFDNIQMAGDISPTIVASGMKVALITTIFGIIVALILQLFYNYINTRIDALTAEMEDSAISLIDIITKKREG